MDTEGVLAEGARGIHLLFDTRTITEAYAQDPGTLEAFLLRRGTDLQPVIDGLLDQPTAAAGRRYIETLPQELQYLLVFLYFELLDGRLAGGGILH